MQQNIYVDITDIIREMGVNGARFMEEHVDPQFKALVFLYEHLANKENFVPLVIANALVSYQLSGRGEDWWREFADWFSKRDSNDVVHAYQEFLPRSRNNRRLTNVKIRRLMRIRKFLESADWNAYYKNMVQLQEDIAAALGTKRDAKTVVFAVKMFGYAMRIATDAFRSYPLEVPIPADSRIKRATKRLGGGDPIRFWSRVAMETGVPPLHIDSIIWPAMSSNQDVKEKIVQSFGRLGEDLIKILSAASDR
ncbi:MAG: N-glycosylase/DNA lyase [Candidatus Diapherotrites archaeon]|nr:N-glycosylase/DNA lyase [Candidatus Diapherotrites archaeon]